jgi:hypothetical protein
MILAFFKCHYLYYDGPYAVLESSFFFFTTIFAVYEEKSIESSHHFSSDQRI